MQLFFRRKWRISVLILFVIKIFTKNLLDITKTAFVKFLQQCYQKFLQGMNCEYRSLWRVQKVTDTIKSLEGDLACSSHLIDFIENEGRDFFNHCAIPEESVELLN